MKNLKKPLIAIFSLLIFTYISSAQSVGINSSGAVPDKSALLDLSSKDKGFLITSVDTSNIVSPAFGLITFAAVDSCLYLYNGINWMGMGGEDADCDCNCSNLDNTPTILNCDPDNVTKVVDV